MSGIEEGEIITLSNNSEYLCLSVKKMNNDNYLLLVRNSTPTEIRFAKEIKDGDNLNIELINKQSQKIELLELFKEQLGIK